MKLKVAHIADIQINVGEKTYHRTREYKLALHNLTRSLLQEAPDVIVYAGDIFERYVTTDIERALWSEHIHSVLNYLPNVEIIAIDGNHDIRNKRFDVYDGDEETVHVHVLEEMNTSLNHPRYHYSTQARLLRFQKFPRTVFACWSELAKHKPDV